ncbi:MAG: cation transporting ATPase C-terminal domain-containing protein, partial [Cyanobium sp.]
SDLPLMPVAPFSNPWLLWAVLLTSGLQLMLLYVPTLARCFGTEPLGGQELLICIGFSLLLFLYLEVEKLVRLWRRSARSDT